MAVLLVDGIHSDPRILMAGDRAVGSWLRMITWLSQWPSETLIPAPARRMFGATPRVIESLVQARLLADAPGGGWTPLGEDELWRFSRSVIRAKIPAELRALIMERDEYRCQKCSAVDNLSLDHIIPWSLGGPDTAENLRVLCRSCNSARGNRMEVSSGA